MTKKRGPKSKTKYEGIDSRKGGAYPRKYREEARKPSGGDQWVGRKRKEERKQTKRKK